MKATLLCYDVPQAARLERQPCSIMWAYGARINLSAWIVPEANLPRLPLDEWRTAGVKFRLVRFDESEADTILGLAREALLGEVGARYKALKDGHEMVENGYQAARAASGNVETLRKADCIAYRHLNRARKALEDCAECALAFGLDGEYHHVADELRKLVKAREALYFQWGREARGEAAAVWMPQLQLAAQP